MDHPYPSWPSTGPTRLAESAPVTQVRPVPALQRPRYSLADAHPYRRNWLPLPHPALPGPRAVRARARPPDRSARYFTNEDPEAEFEVETADVAEVFETWRAKCADARARVAAAPSLDFTDTQDGKEFSLRWIMIHMIEEYTRHNGHGDLIRERIDGVTGV